MRCRARPLSAWLVLVAGWVALQPDVAVARPSPATAAIASAHPLASAAGQQMLDAGEYLVCVGNGETCAGITIGGAVVTVHARYVFGPASLVVFEPGSDEPRTDRIFELGPGV